MNNYTSNPAKGICGSCVTPNCIFQSGIYRETCAYYTPFDKLKNSCNSLLKSDSDECKEQKSKLDCISRQQAIEALMAHFIPQTYTGEQVEQAEKLAQKIMNKVPPVTPTERTGEWIERIGGISKELFYQCSKCYGEVDADEFNYCPWCGAKMKG